VQSDGWAQIRIGVLTPHADVGPESEFCALAPERRQLRPQRPKDLSLLAHTGM